MIFKSVVLSLFSIFSLSYAAFDIQNCNPKQKALVEAALEDAVYLAGRAAQTLEEALNLPGGIPIQVEIILDAFLSPKASLLLYKEILGKT